MERWLKGESIHREGGPAETEFDEETGYPVQQRFFLEGKVARPDDEPSIIQFDPANGQPNCRIWKVDDTYHRMGDRPAVVIVDATSKVTLAESFYQYGKLHRQGAPSHKIWNPDKERFDLEIWSIEDNITRGGDLPAVSKYLMVDGKELFQEEYWKDGYVWRESGPAVIVRDVDTAQIISQHDASEYYSESDREQPPFPHRSVPVEPPPWLDIK